MLSAAKDDVVLDDYWVLKLARRFISLLLLLLVVLLLRCAEREVLAKYSRTY